MKASAVSGRGTGASPKAAQKVAVRKLVKEDGRVGVTSADEVGGAAIEVTAPVVDRAVEPAPAPAPVAPPAHASQPMRHGGSHGMMNGRPPQISRASNKDETFAEGDHVVYPTHGVGRVEKIAVEEIAGHKLELIHITFEENRMTLRVPVAKARSAGLRKLATRKLFDEALAVLKGKARIKRTMWSRRAQEYEAKINSGDPLAIAEVVRDLHRNAGQPDQSFSERQIYEAAMDRLAAELAALDETDKMTATTKLINYIKTLA
jgi:CarD family transcriptional regulator